MHMIDSATKKRESRFKPLVHHHTNECERVTANWHRERQGLNQMSRCTNKMFNVKATKSRR